MQKDYSKFDLVFQALNLILTLNEKAALNTTKIGE